MAAPRFIVGIDLGTSNCAMAAVEPSLGLSAAIEDIGIVQQVRLGETVARPLLPSCLYVPGPHELPAEALALPWNPSPTWLVGEFARWQGARVPGRLITSAKSWLCHAGVDREAAILPWGAPADVPKLSPVQASSQLLEHLARAWEQGHPDAPLSEQEVVITVPASFDEVARTLTVAAAQNAGLRHFTLLEEPQAAFYDFTARHRDSLAATLSDTRLVLVVDVGGGTTDFTLVQVTPESQGTVLKRIAVGDHLMLGGDNMDAALARKVEEKMLSGNRRLNSTQWTQLLQTARQAKETLLGDNAPEHYHLSLVGEGSRLLGGTLSASLSRAEIEETVLEGFFNASGPEDLPRRTHRMALQELGLPYTQETSVPRHLCAFLTQHAPAGFIALGPEKASASPSTHSLPRPDAILLNGGVFNSPQITRRLMAVVSAWWPDQPAILLLSHDSLELAVARGAAYSGLVRRGLGKRITGGTARAFYVGLGKDKETAQERALCLIPRGHDEGLAVDISHRHFNLTLDRPVQFPLFSTSADRFDPPGEIVTVTDVLRPLPPLHTILKSATLKTATVPVHLMASLTEIGTLELWCVANESEERWRLEFELRGAAQTEQTTSVTESMPARFGEAREAILAVFGTKHSTSGPREAKQLWGQLEKLLGPRDQWRLPLLRELWSTLQSGAARRRRSADHERVYYQLLGFCLRPGFGYPLDPWRCDQTFALFAENVQHHTDKAVWIEFWVMWRRISGGLNEAQQSLLWQYLKPHLERRLRSDLPKQLPKPKGIQPEGSDEMIRTSAALEQLSAPEKTELGQWMLGHVETGGPWAWALGRLGARMPLYGSSHRTVPPETVALWLERFLEVGLVKINGAPFAVTQLARLTGDRSRDLEEPLRLRTVTALQSVGAPEHWQQMITEVKILEAADEARALGDTLPAGLQLRELPTKVG